MKAKQLQQSTKETANTKTGARIIIEQAKGSTQGNIIRKIRDQTAITNDGARARIKRAKKKSTK